MKAVLVLLLSVLLESCTSYVPPSPEQPPRNSPPAASSPSAVASDPQASPLEWMLEGGTFRGRPLPLVSGYPITVSLAATELSGVAACNEYWADIERSDGNVRLRNLRAATEGCGGAVDASQEAFLSVLSTITRIDGSHTGELVLEGPEAQLRFRPSSQELPLRTSTWRLVAVSPGPL